MTETPVDTAMEQSHYDNATVHLESTIRSLLSNYHHMYEKRLQNLVFWLDYHYALEYDEPYTDARHYKFMYGTFSPEVRYLLKDVISPPTDTVRRNGGRVLKFICYPLKPRSDPVCDPRIVQWAHENTSSKSTDELIDVNKNTTVYETTDFGHELDLENLDPQPNVVTGGRQRGAAPHTQ